MFAPRCNSVASTVPERHTTHPPAALRMSWFSRLIGGGKSDHSPKPQRLDYLNEALSLERQGDFELRAEPADYSEQQPEG